MGTTNEIILVIESNQIIRPFIACNGIGVTFFSILFDKFDNMATGWAHNEVYLYKTNGSYLNKRIPTVG